MALLFNSLLLCSNRATLVRLVFTVVVHELESHVVVKKFVSGLG